ncbi:MAG TPA: tetratricopeptide repeat protein, partial [Sphingobacterium sp.]|nr:tetratricopeptide repeat protein [Sphingobacterium sp.]
MKKHVSQIARWYRRLLIMLVICNPAFNLCAQSLDSLEQELTKESLSVVEKIKLLRELAMLYRNDNPSRTLLLSKEGLEMAKATGDKYSEAYFYYRLGAAYYRKGVSDSVTINLDKALSLAQEIKDRELEIVTYQLYGQTYRKQGNYSEALEYYLKAVKICEHTNDQQELSAIYTGIGGTYQLMKNYDQALAYYEKAEQLALQYNYKAKLADIYISFADIYARINTDKKKGLGYGKKALSISRELKNSFGEIEALQSIITIYYFFDDYQKALLYADSAIRQTEQLDAPDLSAFSFIMASNIHYDLQQYELCVEKAWKALEADSTNVNLKLNVYSNLSLAHAYLGNPNLTRAYMGYYAETMNSYSNEIYQNSISELEVKYATEKKELKIEVLEKQRQLYIWLGIAGVTILLIALAFAFIRYRLAVSRRKLAEQEAQRLEQEKQLVAVQATLDGEAAERTRMAKDLHDGLGSMLSLVKFNLPQVKGEAVVLESIDVARFQKALGMLDDSIQELRRVAHHMMPESLLRYGLKVSLSDFCSAIPI